jgi:hypothetical protein
MDKDVFFLCNIGLQGSEYLSKNYVFQFLLHQFLLKDCKQEECVFSGLNLDANVLSGLTLSFPFTMNMEITHRNNGTLTGNSLIMWKIIY